MTDVDRGEVRSDRRAPSTTGAKAGARPAQHVHVADLREGKDRTADVPRPTLAVRCRLEVISRSGGSVVATAAVEVSETDEPDRADGPPEVEADEPPVAESAGPAPADAPRPKLDPEWRTVLTFSSGGTDERRHATEADARALAAAIEARGNNSCVVERRLCTAWEPADRAHRAEDRRDSSP